MATTIVTMVPAAEIDVHAPFSAAFAARGKPFASKIVSIGALAGIVTSTMTGLLSQARLFVVLGRQRLLPPRLAQVNPTTHSPVAATIVTGITASVLALFLDINILAELVSVGTLYVFYAVCAGVFFWRCHVPGRTDSRPALLRLASLTITSMALSITFTYNAPWMVLTVLSVLWVVAALYACTLRPTRTPSSRGFSVPLFPLTSVMGVLFTIHLLCSLGWPAYVRFTVWMVVGGLVYGLYGAVKADVEEREARAHGGGDEGERMMGGRERKAEGEGVVPVVQLSRLDHEGPLRM